jgi:hypothetical protein
VGEGRRRHADAKFSLVGSTLWGGEGVGPTGREEPTETKHCSITVFIAVGNKSVVQCGALWYQMDGMNTCHGGRTRFHGVEVEVEVEGGKPGCSCSSARCGSKEHWGLVCRNR